MSDKVAHIGDLIPDSDNARAHTPRNVGLIVDSLHEVGAARSIVIDEDNKILAGNATIEAAGEAGIERVRIVDGDGEEIIAVRRRGLTEHQKRRLALYDNRTAELARWDAEMLDVLEEDDPEVLEGLFTDEEREFIAEVSRVSDPTVEHISLFERFLIPPFSVLDARKGYWQARKRAWLALGIESELGRGQTLTYGPTLIAEISYYKRRRDAAG